MSGCVEEYLIEIGNKDTLLKDIESLVVYLDDYELQTQQNLLR